MKGLIRGPRVRAPTFDISEGGRSRLRKPYPQTVSRERVSVVDRE